MTSRIDAPARARTWLIWAAIVLLTVLPLWLVNAPPGAPGAEAPAVFGGSDDRAQQAIGAISPGYRPWFKPLLTPASDEIASLLFALQAAIGAGVIGYWLGLSVARERARREAEARAGLDAPTPAPSTRDRHAD